MTVRTHTCGELRRSHVGQTVTLNGWVQRRRDHGSVVFIDLRDRAGLTQIVFNAETVPHVHKLGEKLGSEDVIAVTGVVGRRPEGADPGRGRELEHVAGNARVLSDDDPVTMSAALRDVGDRAAELHRDLDGHRVLVGDPANSIGTEQLAFDH